MRILTVCVGNTCRSPMAAGLVKLIAAEMGLDVEVRSAGLDPHLGRSAAENAVTVMQELGVDISADRSQAVTIEALEWADVVVAVQRRFADELLERHPNFAAQFRWLERDVDDPYEKPISEYRRVRDELRELLVRFLRSD